VYCVVERVQEPRRVRLCGEVKLLHPIRHQ
jgi:hypothetical protein